MHSLFAAALFCNLIITVYIKQAAAYLKTCEANSAAPRNAAFALINLYKLLIGGEKFKFKYTEIWKGTLLYYGVCNNNQQCIELRVHLGTTINHQGPKNTI